MGLFKTEQNHNCLNFKLVKIALVHLALENNDSPSAFIGCQGIIKKSLAGIQVVMQVEKSNFEICAAGGADQSVEADTEGTQNTAFITQIIILSLGRGKMTISCAAIGESLLFCTWKKQIDVGHYRGVKQAGLGLLVVSLYYHLFIASSLSKLLGNKSFCKKDDKICLKCE